MRIYISSYDDANNPYYGGGGSIAIHEVAKRLALKHTVTVITGAYPGSKSEIRDSVEYKRIGFSSLSPRLSQILFQILLPVCLMRSNFDIWVESFNPPFSSMFLPFLTNKPVVGLTHLLGAEHMSKKYNIPFMPIENFALRFYCFFITVTKELKNQIREHNDNAYIRVIPNGITVGKYEKHISRKKHILFIGRLDVYQKGLDILLESYKKFEKELHYPLIIAGHGTKNDIQYIKNKIKKLHLEKSVIYMGKVEGSTKKKLFLESIITVVPSRFESFGLVILEAFYYRSPVIIFDIPGLNWINANYCKKVTPFNYDEFGRTMVYLIKHKRVRQDLVDKAFRFAQKFTWDDTANKYERFLSRIYKKFI